MNDNTETPTGSDPYRLIAELSMSVVNLQKELRSLDGFVSQVMQTVQKIGMATDAKLRELDGKIGALSSDTTAKVEESNGCCNTKEECKDAAHS